VAPWSEQDSAHFLDVGRFYVPHRERQLALAASLVPQLDGAPGVIDLGCGEGVLAEVVLGAQPDAVVVGLDGSPAMRAAAARRLARFAGRFGTAACDLHALALSPSARPPLRAIVSSLALHHVDHAAKPRLYRQLHDALTPGGALVVADLHRPAPGAAWELAAAGWDAAVRAADESANAGGRVWQRFQDERWNWFRFPDPFDKPAPLRDELAWLAAAGFADPDVYWADCGHAVFGGVRRR
jgi:tRNA (cmo5U34)-methyltransferase